MTSLKKSYCEIINDNSVYSFNKELLAIINDENTNVSKFDKFSNYIFYGPPCSYKYKSALKLIQYFSPSSLKYEKKLYISVPKTEFYIKISDIHYEIDIENFIYNSKSLWNDIYNIIYNSIASSDVKKGYIVLRNFDKINCDLLDLLYNYMQRELFSSILIRFIIITECISFIPDKIINVSKILYFSKLTKKNIYALSNKANKQFFKSKSLEYKTLEYKTVEYKTLEDKIVEKNNDITLELESLIYKVNNPNIYSILDISNNINYIEHHKSICETYINTLTSNNYNIRNIRTLLYDILIYNLNCQECFFYIIQNLILRKIINVNTICDLIIHSLIFFKNYNNNYRPIFHLESFTLYLIELANENK
jgi:hypothetical protein